MDPQDKSTEQIILEAAEQEFLTHGYEGTTTTDIAKRAGVNHALLHYYFRTKENLFRRIYEQKMQLFGNALVGLMVDKSDRPLIERILAAAGEHFDFLAANPGLSRMLLIEVLGNSERYEDFVQFIDTMKADVLCPLQSELDAEAAAGRMAGIDAVMLIMNIVQLNICSVVIQPYVEQYASEFGRRDHFLGLRRAEVLEIIRKRLTP